MTVTPGTKISANDVLKKLNHDNVLAEVEGFMWRQKQLIHNAWTGEYTVIKGEVATLFTDDAAAAIAAYNAIETK